MKKVTSKSRAKPDERRRNLVPFKQLDETKSREMWFEYSPNSYLQRRTKREIKRERHHKLVEELRYELSLVQDEIEKSSPSLTSDLQSAIDEDLKLMKEKNRCVKDGKIEHADMKNSLNKICAEAAKLASRRTDATETMYQMLIDIEKTRSKRIAAILDNFRQLFAENDYLDQSEIKAFFDFELMNVNDGMLKNVSYYGELRDRYNKSTHECLDSLKSICTQKIASWEKSLISNLQSKLKMAANLNLSGTPLDSKQFTHLQLSFDSELKNFTEKWNPIELILTNQKTFQPWFETLERTLESLDYIAHILLQEYEAFLVKRYTDCESSVNNVRECCSSEAAELFQPLLKSLKNQTETVAYHLKVEWGALIFNFLEEIDAIKEIFGAAEGVKRKYNESLINLQTKTHNQIFSGKEDFTSLSEKEENNNIEELVNCVKVALNVESVNSLMGKISDIYERKKTRLQDSYNKTIKILDAFLETFGDKLHFMHNEIKTCVTFYKDKTNNLVDISEDSQYGKPMFLQSIREQLTSMQESRSRISSVLVSEFPAMLENDCTERAKVWILSKRQIIRKNFDKDMSSLLSRWDYFQSAVYVPRLQEIAEHAEYFNKCKQTLMDFLPEFEDGTSRTLERLNDVNQKLNTWIRSTQKRTYAVYKSNDVKSILSQVFEKQEEFKSSMRNLTNKYMETVSTKEEALINKNFDLVQNLLSLAEHDMYTNEEIAVFCDEFFKLEKEIISKSQNLKGDVLKRNRFLTDESQQYLSILIESLQHLKEDLSFSETVVKFVRRSKTELKEHAFSIKCSGKLFARQIAELTQVVIKSTIWPENAETVILERWKLLWTTLKNRSKLLLSNIKENASSMDKLNIMFSSYANMKVESFNSNNSFLRKVYDILRKSILQIEEVAKNYYEGNQSRKTKPPEQVHATYEDLITEIMQKYNMYVQQCQLEWFKEICDFVDTVALFKEGMDSYVVRFVSNLHENFVEIMNMHNRDAICTLMTIHDNGSQRIREISTHLKPAHGLPKNEHLLNNLKVQFDDCCSTFELMSEENVTRYTIIGEELLENASKELRFKSEVMRSALQEIFDGNVLRNIIYGLKEEFKKIFVPRSPKNSEECVTLNEPHPNSNHTDLVMKSAPCITKIDELRVERTRLKLTALAEESSRQILFDSTEEGSISQFLQNLREIHARTSSQLTKMDSAFKTFIKETRFEWDINVHSIKSMFTLFKN